MTVRRVLMTADAVGGVWTYCLQLATGLARAGVFVDLAVLGPPPGESQRRAALGINGLTLWTAPFRLEWMEGSADDVARSGQWLLELADRQSPDVVHLNGYAHAVLPFQVPRIVVAHSCVLSWWRAVHGCAAPATWNAYARAVRFGLASADLVLAPSAAMLRALDGHYGPRLGPSRVIPNGLAWPRPSSEPKQSMILAAGRLWDRGKNIGALAALAPALPWPVAVAGDGEVGDAPASDKLLHLGQLDPAAMAAAYRRAAIYALPARYEPFGLSVLEAAQRACALVLGDIESLRENWQDAAIFVPPDDLDALERALRTLIADDDKRRALGRQARRRARRFSARLMCRATLDSYEQVIRGQTAAGSALTDSRGVDACAS